MKIGVLGTGVVGKTIASKLAAIGHEVKLGARSATNENAAAWVAETGKGASQGTFGAAAAHGEVVFNCVSGDATLAALESAGAPALEGKILIELANPLDFSNGFPPSLLVSHADSLGEQVQRAFPGAKVVKTLNTINCVVMVDPARAGADHDLLMCGNDPAAKEQVAAYLRDWFGWKSILDLGDITNARGQEAYVLLWARLYGSLGTPDFNLKIVRS